MLAVSTASAKCCGGGQGCGMTGVVVVSLVVIVIVVGS
jgi:hypothetical protein